VHHYVRRRADLRLAADALIIGIGASSSALIIRLLILM